MELSCFFEFGCGYYFVIIICFSFVYRVLLGIGWEIVFDMLYVIIL